jgi:tetratricopeptide (TPR) repeat protein
MAWMLRRLLRWFSLFVLAASMWGCADAGFIIKNMEPLMDELNVSINKSSDVDMLRDAMPANLVQLDGFIEAAPNKKLLIRTSEAYFGYTFAFVEETDKQRASMLYLKARDYALDVLLQERYFRENFNKKLDKFTSSLDEFGKKDVPALYWAANNWMAWIALNLNNPEVLLDIPKVEAMLLRAVELDETFYYGSAHATLGAFYASRSKAIGGDPEKARYHFERAFKLSRSKLLFVHLLYAQYYAYQIQDRDLFVKTLEAVVATPVDYFPEKNFANEIAKRKAQKLLEDVDMYF